MILLRFTMAMQTPLLVLVLVVASAHCALAQEVDPFHFDASKWMSYEHYKEVVKNQKSQAESGKGDADSTTTTQIDANKSAAPQASQPTESAASQAAPEVAAMQKPVLLPVMPGVNKDFSLNVSSTEDEKAPAVLTNVDGTPDLKLPDSNWQKADEAAAHAEEILGGGEANKPALKIRLSSLPDPKVLPSFEPQKKRKNGHAPSLFAAEEERQKKKKVDEAASCAAVDKYKQQQLQAIQSDRKTLEALEAAITQLGLQKELSFLTSAQGSVGEGAPANSTAAPKGPALFGPSTTTK